MVLLKISFLVLAQFGFYASAQKKHICDFENGLCSFLMNDKSNKENWMIGKGKMNSIDTGPSVDHTLGNANGSYVFVNVSAAKTNDVRLQTVVLYDNYCVRFFYHMYGADIGDLTAKVQSVYSPNVYTNYFFRSKTQGDRWKEAAFHVTMSSNMKLQGYRVIFSVKHKNAPNVLGDIAIDDIEMEPSKCPDTKKDVEKLCSFDYSNCGYTVAKRTQNLNWEWQAESRNATWSKPKPNHDHTLGTDKGGYWFVGSSTTHGTETVSLLSPKYKAPENSLGCLHFYYYIEADNSDFWSFIRGSTKEAYIQAYVVTSANSRTLLANRDKNDTVQRQWIYTEAALSISEDYQFEFVAGMETRLDAVIAVDDVKLFPGSCPEAGFCDFEENKCGWKDGEGDFIWLWKDAKSTVNKVRGPLTDNSLKTSDGHYVIISTKGKSPGSEANLESEWFPPHDDTTCLSFYYYLNGNDVGKLKVVRREANITKANIWVLGNDSLNSWRKAMVPLRPSSVYSQVVFQGIIGNGKSGFMALDDVKIRKGEKCDITPAIADPIYEDPETTEVDLSTTEESTETVIPQRYCDQGHKLCKDGKKCIPGLLFCDGVKDCEDGSDELYGCSKASLCGEGFYFCSDRAYPPCIHREKVCDGINDCRDGSDESLCDKCTDTYCQNGGNCSVHDRKLVCSCRPSFYHNRCNKRTATSPEPEDRLKTLKTTEVTLSTTEGSTETVIPRRYCEKGYKLCNDGQQCIPGLLLCDGVRDCEDGSDELYGCNKASLCGEGFYFCSDRAYPPCIHREKICDGIDDCSDGSDESLCDKCIGTFCQNGGNCSVHNRKPVCRCKSTFYHNRCTKRTNPPEPEDRFRTLIRFGLIIGIAIADILLIVITFFICCRRRTNV